MIFLKLKKVLNEKMDDNIQVIAKIESQEGVDNVDSILK